MAMAIILIFLLAIPFIVMLMWELLTKYFDWYNHQDKY